ncbi:hypothetical protein, partial [Halomonas sp. ND22Bw]|uniref:hypothetical protein n=1 Tax=Halomonas sp. ND22Bw TaxID=2054178 RepID=UPI001C634417
PDPKETPSFKEYPRLVDSESDVENDVAILKVSTVGSPVGIGRCELRLSTKLFFPNSKYTSGMRLQLTFRCISS